MNWFTDFILATSPFGKPKKRGKRKGNRPPKPRSSGGSYRGGFIPDGLSHDAREAHKRWLDKKAKDP